MMMRRLTLVCGAALLVWTGAASGQSDPAAARATGPLAPLDVLVGSWQTESTGFSTTLAYRWRLDGKVLEATNEVRDADGKVIGRYLGAYAWDAGRQEVVFWTAGGSGEVHRGRAWWRDGVLWHEADVSGGTIDAYASAVRPAEGRLDYFASYGERTAGPELLRTDALRYVREEESGVRLP